MKITVLVDNYTMINKDYKSEPGFSLFIEEGDQKILFDTGYSDIFINNAKKAKVDLLDVDYIVLSHGHYDHTVGLSHLIKLIEASKKDGKEVKRAKLVMHPHAIIPKLDVNGTNWGMANTLEELEEYFDVMMTNKPLEIIQGLTYLGEIERNSAFEKFQMAMTVNINGKDVEDQLLDDSAMAYETKDGIFVITGCSHAGISNVCEMAKKVTGDDRIIGLVGGLHLKNPTDEQLDRTVEYLETLDLDDIHACHCTGLKAKIGISKVKNVVEVGSGYSFTI